MRAERERERESMESSILQGLIYPPTWFVMVMSVLTVAFLGNNGITEIRGNQLQYSKFWNVGSQKSTFKVSGRKGMFMVYFPAFLFGLASFCLFPNQGLRFILVKSALTIHFLKRTLEVLFVHKYSGPMFVDIATMISLNYFINTALMIYAQHLNRGLMEPQVDLKYPGIAIFLVGLSGNFYHHCLLSNLRGEGKQEYYKIPKGGLFSLVICPHYLFEILGFIGVSCIAQTWSAVSFTLGSAILLMGRSYGTRRWYLSKFEDFPEDVKAIFPFVF
ncbi:steroid 5-alpha-reductase DET2-like [Rhododendron vialii]|uniref:steroid 5-alpha-reductase DET2-like n=1 Tax=Rhododendron vialii TaxID=182163 RepID=UPI00265D71F5|nr:steroid 5-alpha-reductase DET2-like [Rhododendron vialii]